MLNLPEFIKKTGLSHPGILHAFVTVQKKYLKVQFETASAFLL
jgi:hypothetical protein